MRFSPGTIIFIFLEVLSVIGTAMVHYQHKSLRVKTQGERFGFPLMLALAVCVVLGFLADVADARRRKRSGSDLE